MSKKVKAAAPKTLGKAIEIALNDLNLVEKDKKFEVAMDNAWLENYDTSRECTVCFAGSVMAKTCNLEEKAFGKNAISLSPDNFTKEWKNTFNALDSIRRYNIIEALCEFYGERVGSEKFILLLSSIPLFLERDRAWGDDDENNEVRLDLDLRKFFGNVHSYESKPAAFKNNMRKLARLFIKLGV